MILVDFSQVLYSSVIVEFGKDFTKPKTALSEEEETILLGQRTGLVKHMILSSLLSYKKKFSKYGELVLAIDNKTYWRKDVFPLYKGHRARDRETSDIDWKTLFKIIEEVKSDLKETFPYRMVDVKNAEADDVIACLVKYLQTNNLNGDSMFEGEAQDIMIVSSDTDFFQLQKYKNVKQWSPQQRKFVTYPSVYKYMIEHICGGDAGDGIPNIMSADNCIFDKIRQTGFKKARLEEFYEKDIEACKNDLEKERYKRNEILIDFKSIPADIYTNVITEFESQKPIKNVNRIINYMMKNKMKLLLQSAGEF